MLIEIGFGYFSFYFLYFVYIYIYIFLAGIFFSCNIPEIANDMMASSSSPPHTVGGSDGGGGVGGSKYIQHQVTKFDTLPGVAIRYGVEVILFFLVFW